MPPSSTGRRPKRSDNGPITNCPTPKPMMKVDSTICGRLASVRWKADAMFGSAGSIMSIASGLSAMMDAMMTTNSGKPIGRWPEETQASALISDTYDLVFGPDPTLNVAMHNSYSGMAARRLEEVAGYGYRKTGLVGVGQRLVHRHCERLVRRSLGEGRSNPYCSKP